ncbi:MAG: hypothetical protein CL610_05945 [Anaerolineaceae bacterium]|nr:hypothetical protein [Anaerolineaceae bacterium]
MQQSERIQQAEAFKDQQKAIFENKLVKIVEINGAGRIKIHLPENGTGFTERYVDPDELTPITDSPSHRAAAAAAQNPAMPDHLKNLSPVLLGLARLNHPFMEVEMVLRRAALGYHTELRAAHQKTQQAAGWFAITGWDINTKVRQQLVEAGLLESRPTGEKRGEGYEYRITAAGCAAINQSYPLGTETQPVADAAATAVDLAEAVVAHAKSNQVTVKTLRQDIGRPEKLDRADEELTDHLSDGWIILQTDYIKSGELGTLVRFVMLQRWLEPASADEPETRIEVQTPTEQPEPTAETAARPVTGKLVQPVGEPVLAYRPGPWARSLMQNGLDETLDIADQQIAEAFKAAYERSLADNQIVIRPLLPGKAQS